MCHTMPVPMLDLWALPAFMQGGKTSRRYLRLDERSRGFDPMMLTTAEAPLQPGWVALPLEGVQWVKRTK